MRRPSSSRSTGPRSPTGRSPRRRSPGGVASSWQDSPPHAIYIERGQGNRIWDIDGNEYLDFHLGYGAMVAGHAHPKIVEAVEKQVRLGTHFAQPTDGARCGGREPRRSVPPPAVALLQLGDRGDARGRPPDAGRHRPRHDPQDRGQLPRPPRLADVQRHPRPRQDRPARAPGDAAAGARDPAGVRGPRAGGAVQRPRRGRARARRARGRRRRDDRRARDDELRRDPPRPRLPPGPARTCSTSTGRTSRSTR